MNPSLGEAGGVAGTTGQRAWALGTRGLPRAASTHRLLCPSQEFAAKTLVRQSRTGKRPEELLLPAILGTW